VEQQDKATQEILNNKKYKKHSRIGPELMNKALAKAEEYH